MEWREVTRESRILTHSFYNRDAAVVARELLGKILVRGRVAGAQIVATLVPALSKQNFRFFEPKV